MNNKRTENWACYWHCKLEWAHGRLTRNLFSRKTRQDPGYPTYLDVLALEYLGYWRLHQTFSSGLVQKFHSCVHFRKLMCLWHFVNPWHQVSLKFLNSYAVRLSLGHEVFVSLISISCLIQRFSLHYYLLWQPLSLALLAVLCRDKMQSWGPVRSIEDCNWNGIIVVFMHGCFFGF